MNNIKLQKPLFLKLSICLAEAERKQYGSRGKPALINQGVGYITT
ncbi:MAG: hypothetical protein WC980_00370 [Candidatus Brocadiia bacterium]